MSHGFTIVNLPGLQLVYAGKENPTLPRTPPLPTFRTPNDLAAALDQLRPRGAVAFVPTMGALHDGHLSLIRAAREEATVVVASIFVNPTQFGPNEDLDAYPRDEAGDLAALAAGGCHLAYLPSASVMYPPGDQTRVRPGPLSDVMDGAARPGHFEGVCTVVAKLFGQVRPDIALFGEKDFQQLRIIERMTTDLCLTPRIVGVPTRREADGLAMSSRNRYLDADERARAGALPRALAATQAALLSGVPAGAALTAGREDLTAAGFTVDYLDLRSMDDLVLLPEGKLSASGAETARLFVAARLGTTRLIDNLALTAPPPVALTST